MTDESREHVWLHHFVLWDVYFAIVLILTVTVVGIDGGVPPGDRLLAVGFLAGCTLWYCWFGRPLMRSDDEGRRGFVYAAVLLALFAVALVFAPAASIVLLGLVPQAYWYLPPLPATVAVVAFCAAPLAVEAAATGDITVPITRQGPQAVVLVAFAAVMGTWAHRIIRQSRDRAALIDELTATRSQLAAVSREAGMAAERENFAAEIHDTLAQGLSSILMLVQAADSVLDPGARTGRPGAGSGVDAPDLPPAQVELARRHLASAARAARENLAEARAMVSASGPVALEASTISDALSRLVQRFGEDTGIASTYVRHGVAVSLPPRSEIILLRAAQEALANIGKHANAASATVTLSHVDGRAVLCVTDDGVGFDPACPTGGYGLPGMRARIEQAGGRVEVRSACGEGTVVTAEVCST